MREFGNQIPALTPNTTRYPGIDYYEITMRQFTDTLHPSLGLTTTLWGYGAPDGPFKHLGGAIIAQSGRPVRMKWINNLPPDTRCRWT